MRRVASPQAADRAWMGVVEHADQTLPQSATQWHVSAGRKRRVYIVLAGQA